MMWWHYEYVIPNNHSRVIHWKIKSHYWKCILGQLVLKTVFSTVRSCTNHGLGYVFGFIYDRVMGAQLKSFILNFYG